MESNKKILLSVVGVAILIVLVTGVTFAFFNYTRTGSRNIIKTGRIYFNSEQDTSINLTNMFPIDVSGGIPNDNTKVGEITINVVGDTTYDEGIEYLISAVNVSNSVSNKSVPISIDVSVTNNSTNDPTTTLGTSDDSYYTNRGGNSSIYKVLVNDTISNNDQLLVGYITKGSTGIDGNIVIKAYLDKAKIAIVDTYDGTESDNMGTTSEWVNDRVTFTTEEWNSLQTNGVSFQVKVEANEGIWVENPNTLYGIIKNSTIGIDTDNGVDFSKTSERDGTKGVYTFSGTENDTYPVYYYRGAVQNNNILFANNCWKSVRTTETGGVKLIYNGKPKHGKAPISQSSYTIVTNSSTNPFVFDSSDNTWNVTITDNNGTEISFSVPNDNEYTFIMDGTTGARTGGTYYIYKDNAQIYVNGGGGGQALSTTQYFGTLTASNVIKFTYSGSGTEENPVTFKIRMAKPNAELELACETSASETNISVDVNGTPQNMFLFNANYNSAAYNGYMYGTIYTPIKSNYSHFEKYGSSFTWDGTSYKLVDASVTSPNATHHYSCDQTDPDATCSTLMYVYYIYGNTKYYIELTGGDGIEQALAKMQTNTIDSNAKKQVDTWYTNNLINYTNKLEDTIWCNDRSIGDNNNNGWIANGGNLSISLNYGAAERSDWASNTSTVKNQPSLVCANINDRFTVISGNGNGALTYPIALLTEDEMVLAGGLAGTTNSSFYLNNSSNYWLLSSYSFSGDAAIVFILDNGGALRYSGGTSTNGLRPAISLKPGTIVSRGTGTGADPYVIE